MKYSVDIRIKTPGSKVGRMRNIATNHTTIEKKYFTLIQ